AITELSRKKESIWPTLLKKFKLRSRHERRILLKVLIKLLKQYYIEVPSNIKDQLSCGLPCTCPEPPKPPSGSSPEFMSKVHMWLENGKLSGRGLGTRRTPTAESRNKEAADNALRLNLRTDDDLKEFMRAILPDFLGAVSPREDGFIDMLYSADVLTETDNESLSGKDVRNRTEQSVAAELCQRYPHIIPKRFIVTTKTEAGTNRSLTRDKQTVDKCLRHAIQSGIRVKQVADTLFHTDLICYETYSKISFDKIEEEKAWTEIFAAFRDCSEDEDKHLLSLLRANHVLFVPEELEDMRKHGFPCTCDSPAVIPPTSSFHPDKKVCLSRRPPENSSRASDNSAESSSVTRSQTTVKWNSEHHTNVSSASSDTGLHMQGNTVQADSVPTVARSGVSEENISLTNMSQSRPAPKWRKVVERCV
ncbi:hypothetical protein BaRGS_00039129, partial [Batillaria attramentaria]